MGPGPLRGKLWTSRLSGVGTAVDLELLTRGHPACGGGGAGLALRAVLQLVARWGFCDEEERLPAAAASFKG